MKKSKSSAIASAMPSTGMMKKGITFSRAAIEKQHPLKKSSLKEHDPYCYQKGPKRK